MTNTCRSAQQKLLRIGRVTVAYDCLEMATAACRSLRLPKLAIMYLVAHYAWIEHSVSSASINHMANTCRCAQHQGCELYAFIIEIRMREAYDLHDLSRCRTCCELAAFRL